MREAMAKTTWMKIPEVIPVMTLWLFADGACDTRRAVNTHPTIVPQNSNTCAMKIRRVAMRNPLNEESLFDLMIANIRLCFTTELTEDIASGFAATVAESPAGGVVGVAA